MQCSSCCSPRHSWCPANVDSDRPHGIHAIRRVARRSHPFAPRSSVSTTFASLGAPADMVARLAARGIVDPFPIQAATVPAAFAGRDVCGRAPTGSGKTIAFGIPLIARIKKAERRRPRGLVLVPTRELAAQVSGELRLLAGPKGPTVATVYGGMGFGPQIEQLRRGVEIVVACPGRLSDLL